MPSRKEYRNAIRSRQMLRSAFQELLREKPIEKITATDIINKSGLNRSTFYAHYPDVKGIIDEIIGEIIAMFQKMLSQLDFSHFLKNPESYIQQVVVFLGENEDLYRMLSQSHSNLSLEYLEQLKNILIRQIMGTPDLFPADADPLTVEIRVRLLMSGVVDVYRHWLIEMPDCSQERLTQEVTQAVCEMLLQKPTVS